MMSNALLLSGVYLSLGLVVDGARRLYNARWMERISLALDALPGRVLEMVGALDPLRTSYAMGRLNEFWLRIVFGLTTLGIIFGMALLVGGGMWTVRRLVERGARA